MSEDKKRKVDDFISAEEYSKLSKKEKTELRLKRIKKETEGMDDEEREKYFLTMFEKDFDKSPKIKIYTNDGEKELCIMRRVFSSKGKNFIVVQNRKKEIIQWISLEDLEADK